MSKIRIGLIGAGGNTRARHIPGFRAIDDVEVVAVANRTEESSARVAREFDIPRVATSPQAIIDDLEIDAVCIGTWPYRHREYSIAALEAGKHVLCEARMAMDATEAEAMLHASRTHPALVAQVVPAPFDFRLGPTIARMVADGALGDIREVVVQMLTPGALDPDSPANWRQRLDYSGHNTMMLGIFNEVVQRWLGDTIRVVAHARTFVPERPAAESSERIAVEVPDSVGVFADMANGARATYVFSNVAAGAPPAGISLYGTRATLHWQMDDSATFAVHGEQFTPVEPDTGTDRGWQVEADFIRSIREGAPVTLTSFDDGVRYMRFTTAVWRSWNTASAFEVPPVQ